MGLYQLGSESDLSPLPNAKVKNGYICGPTVPAFMTYTGQIRL